MQHLFVSLTLALSVICVQAHEGDPEAGALLTVLRANNLGAYADHLESKDPATLAQFESGNDLTVLAPVDTSDPAIAATPVRRFARLRRQTNGTEPEEQEPEPEEEEEPVPPAPPAPSPSKKPFKRDDRSQALGTDEGLTTKRLIRRHPHNDTGIPPTNFVVRETLLKDPAVVNLGPDEPLKYVTSYYAYENSTSAQLQLETGFGQVVRTVAGPFKYSHGVIYAADSWNILPGTLSETLEYSELTDALGTISQAGQTAALDDRAMITYFAYTDDSTSQPAVLDSVIYDFVGYTPNLESKSYTAGSGAAIVVSVEGGKITVNGDEVVKADVPIRNGVVHFVQKKSPVIQMQGPESGAGERVRMSAAVVVAVVAAAAWLL